MSDQLKVIPSDFDWVEARSRCTPLQVFDKLRLQTKDDVEKRNTLRTVNEKDRYLFTFNTQNRRFWVTVEGYEVEDKGVVFSPSAVGIDVRDLHRDILLLQGVLTLSNDGECKLKIGEVEHTFWQFRKLALEDVLFTSVGKWRS